MAHAGLCVLLALVLTTSAPLVKAQPLAPPVGKYVAYIFDAWGNATYAFDFVLLTPSSPGQPGQYELQMGPVPETERAKWRGAYIYVTDAKRVQWISGPFQRSAMYQPGEKNKVAGKTVEKNGRWTIFLNNSTRGSSVAR